MANQLARANGADILAAVHASHQAVIKLTVAMLIPMAPAAKPDMIFVPNETVVSPGFLKYAAICRSALVCGLLFKGF